jgi:hypothetical protein
MVSKLLLRKTKDWYSYGEARRKNKTPKKHECFFCNVLTRIIKKFKPTFKAWIWNFLLDIYRLNII